MRKVFEAKTKFIFSHKGHDLHDAELPLSFQDSSWGLEQDTQSRGTLAQNHVWRLSRWWTSIPVCGAPPPTERFWSVPCATMQHRELHRDRKPDLDRTVRTDFPPALSCFPHLIHLVTKLWPPSLGVGFKTRYPSLPSSARIMEQQCGYTLHPSLTGG